MLSALVTHRLLFALLDPLAQPLTGHCTGHCTGIYMHHKSRDRMRTTAAGNRVRPEGSLQNAIGLSKQASCASCVSSAQVELVIHEPVKTPWGGCARYVSLAFGESLCGRARVCVSALVSSRGALLPCMFAFIFSVGREVSRFESSSTATSKCTNRFSLHVHRTTGDFVKKKH